MNIKVKTTAYKATGHIEQTYSMDGRQVSRYIIQTQNKQVQKALVELGWKPPENGKCVACGELLFCRKCGRKI